MEAKQNSREVDIEQIIEHVNYEEASTLALAYASYCANVVF